MPPFTIMQVQSDTIGNVSKSHANRFSGSCVALLVVQHAKVCARKFWLTLRGAGGSLRRGSVAGVGCASGTQSASRRNALQGSARFARVQGFRGSLLSYSPRGCLGLQCTFLDSRCVMVVVCDIGFLVMSKIAKSDSGLKALVLQMRAAECALRETTFAVVVYLREQQITPAVARHVMADCGMRPAYISELLRVAFCSEELFQSYKARLLGFKMVLSKARREGEGDNCLQVEAADNLNAIQAAFYKLAVGPGVFSQAWAADGALGIVLRLAETGPVVDGKTVNLKAGGYSLSLTVEKLKV